MKSSNFYQQVISCFHASDQNFFSNASHAGLQWSLTDTANFNKIFSVRWENKCNIRLINHPKIKMVEILKSATEYLGTWLRCPEQTTEMQITLFSLNEFFFVLCIQYIPVYSLFGDLLFMHSVYQSITHRREERKLSLSGGTSPFSCKC